MCALLLLYLLGGVLCKCRVKLVDAAVPLFPVHFLSGCSMVLMSWVLNSPPLTGGLFLPLAVLGPSLLLDSAVAYVDLSSPSRFDSFIVMQSLSLSPVVFLDLKAVLPDKNIAASGFLFACYTLSLLL